MQLVDKRLPPAVLSISNRRYTYTCKLANPLTICRGLQAPSTRDIAIQRPEANGAYITPMRGNCVFRAEDISAHVEAATVA